ncbi:hypothetical protein GCM10027570_24800 [Streptomonospora sediminis]
MFRVPTARSSPCRGGRLRVRGALMREHAEATRVAYHEQAADDPAEEPAGI